MQEYPSITRIQDYVGKQVEIFAFGISYRGKLANVDYDKGTLKIVDGEDSATLQIERVEGFHEIET